MRCVPLDDEFRMDISLAEKMVDDNTCCLVGIAGSTEYGMVDPIPALSDIASDHGIFFHVDAAFGGMVLPFMEKSLPFDFRIPGLKHCSRPP